METWKDLVAAAEAQHGTVTDAQLIAAGMSRRQITRASQTGRLVELERLVVLPAAVASAHPAKAEGRRPKAAGRVRQARRTAAVTRRRAA